MLKVAIGVCVASALLWGAANKMQASGSVEQKVEQLERDLANAELKGDVDGVARIEAADYTFTGPDGSMTGRSDDMNDVKTGNFKADAIDLDDLKARVYGTVAVVTGKATLKNCKYHGQDISGEYRFTDTWAKVNGDWHIVAGQASKLAKP